MLRRQINGLLNKLSDQSKDSIVRAIKGLFDKNSVTVASLVLKDAILAACSHPTQIMTSLIPIYAAIVAALHCSVGIDVGAFMIESLTAVLHKSIAEATNNMTAINSISSNSSISSSGSKSNSDVSLIGSKLPANALLLLVYLYNLRVLHHTLIVDIMNALADCNQDTNSFNSENEFVELKVELLECLINHCGVSIRSDDPSSLKNVINTLSKKLSNLSAVSNNSSTDDNMTTSGSSGGTSRLRFMFEALTDLKNNKSRRIQTTNSDVVKRLRKWLGTIKSSIQQHHTASASADSSCLRVSLQDLLRADSKGRWWRTGASWSGKLGGGIVDGSTGGKIDVDCDGNEEEEHCLSLSKTNQNSKNSKIKKSIQDMTEEEKLLELATKLRMNSATRRNIFVVMMSSRDVTDAFERLSRLELKGKEDREVARVLSECCAQEKTYNAFYAELAKLLCSQHRQYKITFQFVFWDLFKTMMDDSNDDDEDDISNRQVRERKAVNLARLLASLVCSFHLPLTVIKPVDLTTMTPSMILFLSTLLLAIFKEKVMHSNHCYRYIIICFILFIVDDVI